MSWNDWRVLDEMRRRYEAGYEEASAAQVARLNVEEGNGTDIKQKEVWG